MTRTRATRTADLTTPGWTGRAVLGLGLVGAAVACAVLVPPPQASAQTARDLPPSALPFPPGVRIAGLPVERMSISQARRALRERARRSATRPVVVRIGGCRARVVVRTAVGVAAIDQALRAGVRVPLTRTGNEPVNIPLRRTATGAGLTPQLVRLAARTRTAPRPASLRFAGTRPIVITPRPGIRLDARRARTVILRAVNRGHRGPVRLPVTLTPPPRTTGPSRVLILRERFELLHFSRGTLARYTVGVGKEGHATPAGDFRIVTKQINPTWNPPDSPWASGFGPIPPGPENPLGTRWMGISAPGIGIHGTPHPDSVGQAVSHGCIRMRTTEAELLFAGVAVGTPVHIR